jgi:predicted CoA-binding protein
MDVARMSEAHVPEPGTTKGPSHQDLLRIYEQTGTITVVGASADDRKAAHVIPSYLQSQE